MEREDVERLARMEAHLESMKDIVKDGFTDLKKALETHVENDHEQFENLKKRASSQSAQIASIKTKQKLIWSALGALFTAIGFSQVGSLFK
jgi:hypothetical protein